jgi:hypothetical protein
VARAPVEPRFAAATSDGDTSADRADPRFEVAR